MLRCKQGHEWEWADEMPTPCPTCGEFALTEPHAGPVPLLQTASRLPDLPGFEVLRELGRGGMGVVYLVRDVKLRRLYALKMMQSSGTVMDGEVPRRFDKEMRALARLEDDDVRNDVVQIRGHSAHDGQPYFVMDYEEGATLRAGSDGTRYAAGTLPRWWRSWPESSTGSTQNKSCTATSSPRTCCSPGKASQS
jgi:serine/threonine protein kinase